MIKWIIFILMFVLSIYSATATLENSQFLAVYDCQNSSMIDIINANNKDSGTGTIIEMSGNNCKNDGCVYFDGTTNALFSITPQISFPESRTVSMWLKMNSSMSDSYGRVFTENRDAGSYNFYARSSPVDVVWQTSTFFLIAQDITDDVYRHIVITVDEPTGNTSVYFDGVLVGSAIQNDVYDQTTGNLYIGSTIAGGNKARFVIDEFYFINGTVNKTGIQELQNGYYPYINASPPPIIPSLTLNKGLPIDDSQHTELTYFYFNGTIQNTIDLYNCSFLNGTQLLYNDILNLSNNHYYNLSDCYGCNLNLNCTNSNSSDVITWSNIFIDTVQPFISIYALNLSRTYYSDTDYNLNISLYDTNLDGYNLSIIDNNTNIILWNDYVLNETINTTLWITNITNTSDFGIGTYMINITAWDSHNPTNKIHEKASIEKSNSNLNFNYKKGFIKISSDDTSDFNIYDEENKYKIEFDFKNKGKQMITLESDTIFYYKESEHKAHFVFPKLSKYFDLDNENIVLEKIIYGKNKVDIYFTSPKKVKTNSIGDLNINSKVSYFRLIEKPDMNTELLSDINKSNYIISITLNKTFEVLEMMGYFFLLIFGMGLPFMVKDELPIKQTAYFVSIMLMFVLLTVLWGTFLGLFVLVIAMSYLVSFPMNNSES